MTAFLLAASLLLAQARQPVTLAPSWKSGGPDGGGVPVLASTPDGATIYAGTGAGLFQSKDGGVSWKVLDFIPQYSPSSMVYVGVAPSNPSVVYAANSVPTIHFHHIELSRSEDAGATWTSAQFGIDDDFFTKFNVVIDPTDAMTIYGSINCCSSKSTDGGRTWTAIPPSYVFSITSIALDPSNPSTLFGNAFVEDTPGHVINHLQKSVDAGETWASSGLVTESEFSLVDPDDSRFLYAPGTPFARSDDGGLSISTETTSPGSVYELEFGGGTPRRLYARVADSGSIVLYVSLDRGVTWSRSGAPPGGGLDSFVVPQLSGDQDRILAGAPASGVFLSNDGGVYWEPRSAGLRAADIGSLVVVPTDARFAYAVGPGFAKTSDGGVTWSVDPFTPVAMGGGLAVDPTNHNLIYAADQTAGIRHSIDGGATWSAASPTDSFVTSIDVDPLHPATVYAADGRPLKSTDGGGTWRIVNAGIPDGVKLVRVDPSNPSVLYATVGSPYPPGGTIYRSTNAGEAWSQALGVYVDSLAPDPGHPGTVYAGASFLYRSVDYGATWSSSDPGLDSALISLACDANGVIYAAARDSNPYFLDVTRPVQSVDGGASFQPIGGWGEFTPGLPSYIGSLAVDLAGTRLYAATERGVWTALLRGTRQLDRQHP